MPGSFELPGVAPGSLRVRFQDEEQSDLDLFLAFFFLLSCSSLPSHSSWQPETCGAFGVQTETLRRLSAFQTRQAKNAQRRG